MSNIVFFLTENLWWTLAVLVMLVAALALLVGKLLRRGREAAQYAEIEDRTFEGELDVVDFRADSPMKVLRLSFARALERIDELLPSPNPRYQIPWFLSLGQTAAGKTTFLGQADLTLPYGEPVEQPGLASSACNWWLYDRAIVLDAAGELFLRLDGSTADQVAWHGLLELIRKARDLRPIDGVILTLPAIELLDFDAANPLMKSDLLQRAEILHRKLTQAQSALGMQFPVWLVITKSDRIEGFDAFTEVLSPAEKRQMFGWSQNAAADAIYSGSWIEEAFGSLLAGLDRLQMRIFGTDYPLDQPRAFFRFPTHLERLKEPLLIYANQIFSPSAMHPSIPLRGLYFVGGDRFDLAPPAVPEALQEVAITAGDERREVFFLSDLLSFKIFHEWSLSRLIEKAIERRHRRLRLVQAALVAVLLYGTVGFWWGASHTRLRARTLEPYLTEVDSSLRSLAAPSESSGRVDERRRLHESRAKALLSAVGSVEDYRLRSFFLPASWLSGSGCDLPLIGRLAAFGCDVRQAVRGADERVILPAMRQTLEHDLAELATGGRPPLGATAQPLLEVEGTAEFGQLSLMVGELAQVEAELKRFDCLALGCSAADPLADLAHLSSALYDLDLELPNPRARAFQRRALREARAAPSHGERPDSALSQKTLERSERMYDRLYERNLLSLDVSTLNRSLVEFAAWGWPPEDAAARYRQLLDQIEQVQADLGRPRLEWATRPDFALGPAYDQLLASVGRSPFLGTRTRLEMHRLGAEGWSGQGGFIGFRRRLLAAQVRDVGPLLSASDDGTLKVSSQLGTLRSALESLLQEPFMEPENNRRMELILPSGQRLIWNDRLLSRAVSEIDGYQEFLDGGLQLFPAELQPAAQQAALDALEVVLLDLLAQAQTFRPAVLTATLSGRESELESQVENLSSAGEDLAKLLDGAGRLRLDRVVNDLTTVLAQQRRRLLEQTDTLLQARDPYRPRQGTFAWWQGDPVLSFEAYGVQNAKGLEGYLGTQLDIVTRLAQQVAQPVLEVIDPAKIRPDGGQPLIAQWRGILADLEALDNKQAGNAPSLLDDYIITTLGEVDRALCASKLAAGTLKPADDSDGDFFLAQRFCLQEELAHRCYSLVEEEAFVGYQQIGDAFSRLAGKFPFTVAASKPQQAEITPDDLRQFYTVFDARQASIMSLPANSRAFGDHLAEVKRFVEQMQSVRQLFAYFLDQETDPKAVPAYKFSLQFRVDREREKGASDIIRWVLEVGDNPPIVLGGADLSGSWSYATPGQATEFSLGWAADGPIVPVASLDEKYAVRDGRTVVYRHASPWSLISWIRQHAEASKSSPTSLPLPETLRFHVLTRRVDPNAKSKKGQPALPAKSEEAIVFLRITLKTPDDAEQTVPFPDVFPVAVPRVVQGETTVMEAAGTWCSVAFPG